MSQAIRSICRYKCRFCDFLGYKNQIVYLHAISTHCCHSCGKFFTDPNSEHSCNPVSTIQSGGSALSIDPWRLHAHAHLGYLRTYALELKPEYLTISSIFEENKTLIDKIFKVVLHDLESVKLQCQIEVLMERILTNQQMNAFLNSDFLPVYNFTSTDKILFTQMNQIITNLNNFNSLGKTG